MELNYAILRVEPIKTIPDLAQIGSHNKREKKAYQSTPKCIRLLLFVKCIIKFRI